MISDRYTPVAQELHDGMAGCDLCQPLDVHLVAALGVPIFPWADVQFLAKENDMTKSADSLSSCHVIEEEQPCAGDHHAQGGVHGVEDDSLVLEVCDESIQCDDCEISIVGYVDGPGWLEDIDGDSARTLPGALEDLGGVVDLIHWDVEAHDSSHGT